LLTTGLLALLGALHLLFPGPESLAFDASTVGAGETWRLVSGHFAHADIAHLAWNGLGLAVLGCLIERQGRRLLVGALLAGVVAVSALLASPLCTLAQYCGLSGVLNSLLVVALFLEWRRGSIYPVALIAVGSLAKLAWELTHGSALFTEISWPPYPAAHAAGMLGGIGLIVGVWLAGAVGSPWQDQQARRERAAEGEREGRAVDPVVGLVAEAVQGQQGDPETDGNRADDLAWCAGQRRAFGAPAPFQR
jgi:rhomboid family GlyGly-CTERM serine protease